MVILLSDKVLLLADPGKVRGALYKHHCNWLSENTSLDYRPGNEFNIQYTFILLFTIEDFFLDSLSTKSLYKLWPLEKIWVSYMDHCTFKKSGGV